MRTIYWLRMQWATSGAKSVHDVEFATAEELNVAVAELHLYDPEDFALAASGSRTVPFHHKLVRPPAWERFREAAIAYKNAPKVLSAMDADAPPVKIDQHEHEQSAEHYAEQRDREPWDTSDCGWRSTREPRYEHYKEKRATILLTSAAVAIFAIYLLWEWWS